MNEVCSVLRTNFDSQQNEGLKWFFRETKPSHFVYHNRNYPFVLSHQEKKLDSFHERSSSHFKDEIWFLTKQKAQLLFLRNQGISIMYPNGNYPFFIAGHKKKLDSFHERSSSHWFPTKWRVEIFFLETKASISCIPMGTINFSLLDSKRN